MKNDIIVPTEHGDVSSSEHLNELLHYGTLTISDVEARLIFLNTEDEDAPIDSVWYSGQYDVFVKGILHKSVGVKGSLIQMGKAALEELLLTSAKTCIK